MEDRKHLAQRVEAFENLSQYTIKFFGSDEDYDTLAPSQIGLQDALTMQCCNLFDEPAPHPKPLTHAKKIESFGGAPLGVCL